MYKDSIVLRSYILLGHFDKISNWFVDILWFVLQWCSIMAEWFGVCNGFPVLTDTPKCSDMRHRNCRLVEPTYEELHSSHLYLYITDEHKGASSFSLFKKWVDGEIIFKYYHQVKMRETLSDQIVDFAFYFVQDVTHIWHWKVNLMLRYCRSFIVRSIYGVTKFLRVFWNRFKGYPLAKKKFLRNSTSLWKLK